MGCPGVDGTGCFRWGLENAMKQATWYLFQTAIVVGVVAFDSTRPNSQPGVALLLGVGWALSATVVIHLFLSLARKIRERWNNRRGVVTDRRGRGRRGDTIGQISLHGLGHSDIAPKAGQEFRRER